MEKKNFEVSSVSRRQVLRLAAGAALVLTVPSNLLGAGGNVESLSFYVDRFATAIGSKQQADSVKGLYEKADQKLRADLDYVNRMMANSGFSDYSRSVVYSSANTVFYSVVFQDGFNVCLPFIAAQDTQAVQEHGNQAQSQFIGPQPTPKAMIEGPSVVALALASEDVRKDLDATTARSYLLPQQRTLSGNGTFESGYTQPDLFLTEAGTVRIDYRRTSRQRGRAYVQIVRGDTREVVFEKSYDIRYNSRS